MMSAIRRQPVRILHVVQSLNYGGMERLIADLVRHIDPLRFESSVLCLEYAGRFARDLQGLAEVHVIDRQSRASMLWPQALIAGMRRMAPRVVHSHSGVWHKAAIAARASGVRWMLHTDHGRSRPISFTDRMIERRAAGRTDIVVAVSDTTASELVASGIVALRGVRTIRNGVDTDAITPRSDDMLLRRELGIASDVPIVGSVGRLEAVKAYDLLIAAFARLRRHWTRTPAPVLVIAGDGSCRKALEQSVRALGLEGAVHLIGWRDDIRGLLAAFTVFTMSSRSEGTSVSLLEAMSAGRCPVVTSVGGNPAVLGPALQHRLVAPGEIEALADALLAALDDDRRRGEDEVIARARVVSAFSLRAMVAEYERLYAAADDR